MRNNKILCDIEQRETEGTRRLTRMKTQVQDVSGGCGSMYALDIVSAKFKGLSVIKQHRLVNAVLKDEIKGWHGVQLKTKAP
jgi:stress-induced morphogen